MTDPKPLLADDICRVCFHVHPYAGRCGQREETPSPTSIDYGVCDCREYVDLEAESRIVVEAPSDD